MISPRLLVIVGSTASGKSNLALQIAKKYNGELICADSRTVYKGMDIGTGKPSQHDQKSVPHHLLDIVEPDQPFTAAQFKDLANVAIKQISNRGKLPILVGGTGLYIDAVIFDYQFGEPADAELRSKLNALNNEELLLLCSQKDIAIPVNHRNKRHLIRAIELGGLVTPKRELRDNILVVGITTDNDELKIRIVNRTHAMFQAGVIEEARRLSAKFGWQAEAMTANVYRIAKNVIAGEITPYAMFEQVVKADMSLAKRQRTWFKRNPYIKWGSPEELRYVIADFLV